MRTEMSPLMRGALDDVIRKLTGRFRGVFSEETVALVVEDSYERLGDEPTAGPNFTPVFVERFARERLQAAAQADGLVPKTLPEILFICVRNAGRSQMAAALTHELSKGQVSVRSAGSDPTERIHPVVVEAMKEIGIDVRMEFPKAIDRRGRPRRGCCGHAGCGDACPIFPGKRYEDWDVAIRPGSRSRSCAVSVTTSTTTSQSCSSRSGISGPLSDRTVNDPWESRIVHRVAVITDIHGNLPALQASLDALDAIGIDEIYCGGDLVGYGPHPNEVCALVAERQIPTDLRQLRLRDRSRSRGLRVRVHHTARPRTRPAIGCMDARPHRPGR